MDSRARPNAVKEKKNKKQTNIAMDTDSFFSDGWLNKETKILKKAFETNWKD